MRNLIQTALILFVLFGCKGKKNHSNAAFELYLDGKAKFILGDSLLYSRPDLVDTGWKEFSFGKTFNKSGLINYDGFAWYRYKLVLPSTIRQNRNIKKLEFYFGKIDDCDQLYFNGKLIGSNGLLEDSILDGAGSARDIFRKYEIDISAADIRWDQPNVLALRVLDLEGDGGVAAIPFVTTSFMNVSHKYKLGKYWKFIAADKEDYSRRYYNDTSWTNLQTGISWEWQGFSRHDGVAWYQTKFITPPLLEKEMQNGRVNLHLGKIDDNDQTYLNGIFIGEDNETTGPSSNENFQAHPEKLNLVREYHIDTRNSKFGWSRENFVAIRVLDKGGSGGLFGRPYMEAYNFDDDLLIDDSHLYTITNENKLDTFLVVHNRHISKGFTGTIKYEGKRVELANLVKEEKKIEIGPQDSILLPVSMPFTTDEVQFTYRIVDTAGSTILLGHKYIPFVLAK